MKILRLFLLIVFTTSYAQKKENKYCSCDKDSLLNNLANCEEKILKDKSTLYYQFNCDSIWLTLKNNKGKKIILYSLSDDDYKTLGPLNYRLGYYFVQEFKEQLLFREGCPATGSCSYVLVDKKSGKRNQEFNNLIFDLNKEATNDFIIYFGENIDVLIAQFVDSKKKIQIPINKKHFTQIIPEFQFDEVYVIDNKLIMTYDYDDNGIDKTGRIEQNITGYVR